MLRFRAPPLFAFSVPPGNALLPFCLQYKNASCSSTSILLQEAFYFNVRFLGSGAPLRLFNESFARFLVELRGLVVPHRVLARREIPF